MSCVVFSHGKESGPWGRKITAMAALARDLGLAVESIDYRGMDDPGARVEKLVAVSVRLPKPLVLVGSSMGGWLACLVAMARLARVKALVLIAPATDFTERLLRPSLPPEAAAALERDGVWIRPSAYDDGGYPSSARLLEDGALWTILEDRVWIAAPARILQGGADPDVPWRHALALAEALEGKDVVFTLIRDGDHRLSRPVDLARLIAAVEEVAR